MIKRIFCFIVVLCLMLCNLTFAAEIERSGTCGENLTWTLDSNGLLTISGTGDMTNFVSISYTPWQPYNEKVKKIVIEDGVFFGKFKEWSLPNKMQEIVIIGNQKN